VGTKISPASSPIISSAYLLVSHGSRDARPQAAMNEIARQWREKQEKAANTVFDSNFSPVETATLELNVLPLHLQIQEFGKKAIAAGYQTLEIVPLFLLPGVHVMEDIPAEAAKAQSLLSSRLEIKLNYYIGTHPRWKEILAGQIATLNTPNCILLSHGSRRLDGNRSVEKLAAELGVTTAYWSVSPTLAERVSKLVSIGIDAIAIQPYFLFPGEITDAIAQSVTQLQSQYPQIQFNLGHLVSNSALLELISA
jgi:sirohydrochlorin cobaltochelatase